MGWLLSVAQFPMPALASGPAQSVSFGLRAVVWTLSPLSGRRAGDSWSARVGLRRLPRLSHVICIVGWVEGL